MHTVTRYLICLFRSIPVPVLALQRRWPNIVGPMGLQFRSPSPAHQTSQLFLQRSLKVVETVKLFYIYFFSIFYFSPLPPPSFTLQSAISVICTLSRLADCLLSFQRFVGLGRKQQQRNHNECHNSTHQELQQQRQSHHNPSNNRQSQSSPILQQQPAQPFTLAHLLSGDVNAPSHALNNLQALAKPKNKVLKVNHFYIFTL